MLAAGGLQGDLIDEANAEAELQIRLHQTDGRLLRAIEEALGRIRQGTYGIAASAISLSLGSSRSGALDAPLQRLQGAQAAEWCCGGKIISLPGVKMADACWGSRDVFAVVEVAESPELNKLVMDTIQRPEGFAGTSTHIALDQVVFGSISADRTCSTCPS